MLEMSSDSEEEETGLPKLCGVCQAHIAQDEEFITGGAPPAPWKGSAACWVAPEVQRLPPPPPPPPPLPPLTLVPSGAALQRHATM